MQGDVMTAALEQYAELPTYFAEGAFAATRIDHSGIYYDTHQLTEASSYLQQEIGRGLPGEPEDITFVYRFAEPGYQRPKPDADFFKANPATLYVPAGHLALGTGVAPATVTRADILAENRPIMQVRLKDGMPPNMGAVAESILWPEAEDLRMKASLIAWRLQLKEAFTPREAPERKRRLMEHVAARYAGAILLERRRPTAS
jgi:hypothetical protein